MSVRPLEINDPPIQSDNESSNNQQIIDDILSENQNNDSLNSLNYNQDNEDKGGTYNFTDFRNKLEVPYNNCPNIDSSIDYHNIEQSQNSKELTQINGINKKDGNIINQSQIKFIVVISKNKEKEGKQDLNEINVVSTNSNTKEKKISTGRNRKKKFNTKDITKSQLLKFIIKNINENEKTMHTKHSVDNVKRKVFTHVNIIIHNLIKKIANKYMDKNDKLYEPTITPQMGKKKRDSDLKKVSKYHIENIYYTSSGPKNSKARLSALYKTEILIEKIIQKEEEDPNAKIKILKIIFNKTLREFILLYLNDNPFLNIYEDILEEPIDLRDYDNEFITYKNDMNDIDPLKKEQTKEKLIKLLTLNE